MLIERIHSRLKRDHDHEDEPVDSVKEANQYNFRPRKLRKCVRDALQQPMTDNSNNITTTCVSDISRRRDIPTREREDRRQNMFIEVESFSNCLCDLHSLNRHCLFNLILVERNETVLNACLGREFNVPFYHPPNGNHFSCNLRRNHRIACRRTDLTIPHQNTRFENILGCLTDSLSDFQCPEPTTVPTTPKLFPTTTTPVPHASTGLIILVLSIVISLLLGVLGTGLGIFCWRKKEKKRKSERILKALTLKPEHASQPNLYDPDYTEDHIYDTVKSDESPTSHDVPDLLRRVPSIPPITNRKPINEINHMTATAEYSCGSDRTETYEPLLPGRSTRSDRHNTEPKTPDSGGSSPINEYLPLVGGSVDVPTEQQTRPRRYHPYDEVIDSDNTTPENDSQTHSTSAPSNKTSQDSPNYFILDPQFKTPGKGQEGTSEIIPSKEETVPKEIGSDSYEGSKYVIAHPSVESNINSMTENINDDVEGDPEWDGYEIPVPEVPSFDIASSFKVKDTNKNTEV